LFTQGDERSNILGEARPAVTETGVEKAASDSFVRSNPIGNLFDICSTRFANGGQRINIRNFEGKKGVGGVA